MRRLWEGPGGPLEVGHVQLQVLLGPGKAECQGLELGVHPLQIQGPAVIYTMMALHPPATHLSAPAHEHRDPPPVWPLSDIDAIKTLIHSY